MKKICALITLFLLPFSIACSAEPSKDIQEQIWKKICEPQAQEACMRACEEKGSKDECANDCGSVLAAACGNKTEIRKSKGWPSLCETITTTICHYSSTMCSDADQSGCLGWCVDVVVGGCPK
jgi:hypothetical protein